MQSSKQDTDTSSLQELKEEKEEDVFDYNYMNQYFDLHPQQYSNLKSGNYRAEVMLNRDFIFIFSDKRPEGNSEGVLLSACGLKFHVSLPENNASMFAQGWKIIKDILIEHK